MDDLVQSLKSKLPQLRGRLLANEPLAPLTWFRVGGPAQALFMPEDESDLACLLTGLPRDIPVTVIGLGSNLIVRDGGVEGVVIRLGRGFNETRIETGNRVRSGTAVPDLRVAKAAQEAGIAGLAFYRGHSGRDRRRAAHERRRLRTRDQGCAGRSARRRPIGRHP
jgi:UDP-N-acetylmuramate dehydrogenase